MRLNKFLSHCGVASRRAADQLILAGKVAINGERVEKPGVIIDEKKDQVTVDNVLCRMTEVYTYIMVNKPPGYLVTLRDSFGRKTVTRLLKGVTARVYPIGRLDLDSEGLLLMTDDGELAFRLAHPRFGVTKDYTVKVKGQFKQEDLRHFFDGITLDDGFVAHAKVKIEEAEERLSTLTIQLSEGRKREIKRMCKAIGYPVVSIKRIKFADLSLMNLQIGDWRHLNGGEVDHLKRKVGLI